jgi:LuxR family transcriptional regulator, quorum-sensing system regulator BjaR1
MSTLKQTTFEVIHDLDKAKGTDEVLALLRAAGDDFGYENFCIAGIPNRNEHFAPHLMLSGWPKEWLDRYDKRDYVHVDPVIAALKQTTRPVVWGETQYDKGRGSRPALMMNEAREIGLGEGVSVPIYSLSGSQAAVSFGASKLEVTPELRGALHLVAIYAHARLRELLIGKGNLAAVKALALSPREIECLTWSSEGKTAWEISCILGLAQKTVEHYLASAAQKLNATNRSHAIAQAFRARIIH